jgi:hypothetical protein
MAVLKTGLGERLVSTDVEAKAFDQLPVIDLSRLSSDKFEDRKALAEEVSPLLYRGLGIELTMRF